MNRDAAQRHPGIRGFLATKTSGGCPDQQQQAVLTRTFGCIRVVWNRTLAARHARWQHQREGTSYAQTDAALTAMKREQDLSTNASAPGAT
jgi:hypothetical protein